MFHFRFFYQFYPTVILLPVSPSVHFLSIYLMQFYSTFTFTFYHYYFFIFCFCFGPFLFHPSINIYFSPLNLSSTLPDNLIFSFTPSNPHSFVKTWHQPSHLANLIRFPVTTFSSSHPACRSCVPHYYFSLPCLFPHFPLKILLMTLTTYFCHIIGCFIAWITADPFCACDFL